jgi:queuine tRNA-ribosyltransferase
MAELLKMSKVAPETFGFELLRGGVDSARAGVVRTAHGDFNTPAFMAVGTQGTAKGLSPSQLRQSRVQVLLGNTYHLALRPGAETVAKLGGLHEFSGWRGPMLTDSGGFQIWSLKKLASLSEEGATFRSHLDGSKHVFTPEKVIYLEETLGADMIMPLDECLEYPAEENRAKLSAERTLRWAERSIEASTGKCALFGIVQGGAFRHLRIRSAEKLVEFGFAGYALGGLSVGEGPSVFRDVLSWTLSVLPQCSPRYIMGVGEPEDLLEAIEAGADMFDCVLPTRNGRRGMAYTRSGKLRLRNACFREDPAVIEAGCDCPACAEGFSRGYIRHLLNVGELLGGTLVAAHNLSFFSRLMAEARDAILDGRFVDWKRQWIRNYASE